MLAGRLDRRIRIEQRTVTRGADGSETVAWALVAEVWAQVQPLRGQERYGAGAEQAERDARIRIRWLSGVSAGMRVVYEARAWDVQAILEVGRRHGLDLLCVAQQA
jgi:SPP1 family predicted phage head-tail adaptor